MNVLSSHRKVECPPQTGLYKVKVKEKSGRKSGYTVATFDISVGGPNHEGEKFEAQCVWARDRFDKVIVSVNDSLQRYNFMFEEGGSSDFALHKSIKEGAQWLERNKHAIDMLGNKQIVRWEDFRQRHDFTEKLARVYLYYAQHPDFQQDVYNQSAEMFLRRYPSALCEGERFDRFIELSKLYILEETAVFAMMGAEVESVHVYPGTFMRLWNRFREHPAEGLEALSELAYCRIDFSRNKAFAMDCAAAA